LLAKLSLNAQDAWRIFKAATGNNTDYKKKHHRKTKCH
jgi:hypothetical protein